MTSAALTPRDAAAELLRQAHDRISAVPFTARCTLPEIHALRLALDAVDLALRALGEAPDQRSREELDESPRATAEPTQIRCFFCTAEFSGATDRDALDAYVAHTCDPGPPPVVPWDVLIGTRRSSARCGMRR